MARHQGGCQCHRTKPEGQFERSKCGALACPVVPMRSCCRQQLLVPVQAALTKALNQVRSIKELESESERQRMAQQCVRLLWGWLASCHPTSWLASC